jgi:uncharacterized damage-inducible protein DinB
MAISDALLPEFDHEMQNTRKTLERIPDEKFGWKPHEKSMTLGRLSAHLAEIPVWTNNSIEKDSIDVAPLSGPAYKPFEATSRKEVLAAFDANVAAARKAIAAVSDQTLMKPWSLLMGGKTIMTMPKVAVLRSFVMNHTIHHRAQLGVYLRLNNLPVPAIYGPSADEQGM